MPHVYGWCTWDAFYQSVDPAGVRSGLRSLKDAGTPASLLILDDGWQTVEDDGDAMAAAKQYDPSHRCLRVSGIAVVGLPDYNKEM